jgi:hypothetical protein
MMDEWSYVEFGFVCVFVCLTANLFFTIALFRWMDYTSHRKREPKLRPALGTPIDLSKIIADIKREKLEEEEEKKDPVFPTIFDNKEFKLIKFFK